ncbi:MAG: anti-sigma factor antagonist [Bacteroidota bacterium]|nr:anti-sigma factor antagonist [Bacteroidota bacterium]
MSLSVKSEVIENVAIITIEGALDSSTASQLHEEVQKIIQQNPTELVLNVENLDFMASAGLRVIIFAKQKLGSAVKLFLVKPQEQVVETLRMTGLLFSVTIVDKYPE